MSIEPEDPVTQRWLEVLSGRTPPAPGVPEDTQAAALRRALQARRERLLGRQDETEAADQAHEAGFQRLRFRLRREGLLRPAASWRRPGTWAVAATVMLGLAVLLQMAIPPAGDDDADVLRGASSAVVLIVPDVNARLAELRGQMLGVGVTATTRHLADGRVLLRAQATPAVLDLLAAQRIEPQVQSGEVALILAPAAKP